MNKVTNDAIGVDISNDDPRSSALSKTLEIIHSSHPLFLTVVDSLSSQFGSMFSEGMLRFHSRLGSMCRTLYDHLSNLVREDSRPIRAVLFDVVKRDGILNADLATCMRLILDLDYVQVQVGNTFVEKVWFRMQQVLRVNSVSHAKSFIVAYRTLPKREAIDELIVPMLGNYLSRRNRSGVPLFIRAK